MEEGSVPAGLPEDSEDSAAAPEVLSGASAEEDSGAEEPPGVFKKRTFSGLRTGAFPRYFKRYGDQKWQQKE